MIHARSTVRAVLFGALLASLIACDRGDDPAPPAATPHDTAPTHHEDPPTVHHHAQQMDSTIADMRRHVQAMQQVPPEQWQARMSEHATRVERMLSLVDQHMRAMDAAAGAHAEEHRQMAEQMQALRRELQEVQTAPLAEVRRRMPDHLTRIQQFLLIMERSAEHMRGVH